MKKKIVIGLVILSLIVGFLFGYSYTIIFYNKLKTDMSNLREDYLKNKEEVYSLEYELQRSMEENNKLEERLKSCNEAGKVTHETLCKEDDLFLDTTNRIRNILLRIGKIPITREAEKVFIDIAHEIGNFTNKRIELIEEYNDLIEDLNKDLIRELSTKK